MRGHLMIWSIAALAAVVFVVSGNWTDQSYTRYQRQPVASDYTTPVGPTLASWQCPTYNARLDTLTEPCK
jgi:hypothetical protein